jgi:hypothetical protein
MKPVKHGNRVGEKPKQDGTQDNFFSCSSVRLVPTVLVSEFTVPQAMGHQAA